MDVLSYLKTSNHEQVLIVNEKKSGLQAIIAIHSTKLGPSLGGTRMMLYPDFNSALKDVLLLSEGMTYKSSLAGLNLGGGKACIIADPQMKGQQRVDLFLEFAKAINSLSGKYITAEDMGTSVTDLKTIKSLSSYTTGYPKKDGGSGDPSPWTALGVFTALKQAATQTLKKDVTDLKVSIQGVGHVGYYLAKHLLEAGAKICISDVDKSNIDKLQSEFEGVQVAGINEIYNIKADIFSPCAIGQTINKTTLKDLDISLICGAANNQIADKNVYEIIEKNNIIYLPDFAINSGGVISVASELNKDGWLESEVTEKVLGIAKVTENIILEYLETKVPTETIALNLAKKRLLK